MYLVTGSNDCLMKLEDYENKICMHIIEGGHTNNITTINYHPDLSSYCLAQKMELCKLKRFS